MSNASLGFWTNVNDFRNKENMTVLIEGETGKPITVTVRDRESRETLLVFLVPLDAASSIGQAMMLAGTMAEADANSDSPSF